MFKAITIVASPRASCAYEEALGIKFESPRVTLKDVRARIRANASYQGAYVGADERYARGM